MDRRKFLQIMGLISGTTLLSSCGSDSNQKELISYLVPPEDGVRPGTSAWRVSTCSECPAGCGIEVRLREGRAVKLEGNKEHPINHGALCMRGQAALWRLYHPERLRTPLLRQGNSYRPVSWDTALDRIAAAMHAAAEQKRDNRLLSGSTTGALARLHERFAETCAVTRLPAFEYFSHAALRQTYRLLYGRNAVPSFRIEESDLLLSIGADLLETFVSPAGYTRQLATARHDKGLRWYHVEPHLTLTGANADQRLTVRAGGEAALLLWLLRTLAGSRRFTGRLPSRLVDLLPELSTEQAVKLSGIAADPLQELASALEKAGRPLLIFGGVAVAQGAGQQTALWGGLLQYLLSQHWQGLDFGRAERPQHLGDMRDLAELNQDLSDDGIGVLLISRADPLRFAPRSWRMGENLRRAGLSVVLDDQPHDTARQADLVLPLSHSLERWDDTEPRAGLHSLIQPAMAPLHDSLSEGDILLRLQKRLTGRNEADDYEAYLKSRWRAQFDPAQLRDLLLKGFVLAAPDRTAAPLRVEAAAAALKTASVPTPLAEPVTVISGSIRSYDGRGAALPLLNEIPDPLTTITYDTWVSVSPATAARLHAEDGDTLRINGTGFDFSEPAKRQPGLPDGVFGLTVDSLGAGVPGIDAATGEALCALGGGQAARTGKKRPLPVLSGSPSQQGRGIIPKPVHLDKDHHAEHRSLYPEPVYKQYRWIMAIDLQRCVGCGACAAACYVENSVPLVGRREHLRGREMSWLRIEPFYDPQGKVSFIPMLCQHCDYAPCEPVCPVYAAHHNNEGLNLQIYNRCVGTRYCSNNCPYKVRRFNWWNHQWQAPLDNMLNPDLAPRTRGMMEKCTFCIQRIRAAHETAAAEKRPIRDGEVMPACAQSCPARAISFGNLLDPASKVARMIKDPRAYRVFASLGTGPAVYYLKP